MDTQIKVEKSRIIRMFRENFKLKDRDISNDISLFLGVGSGFEEASKYIFGELPDIYSRSCRTLWGRRRRNINNMDKINNIKKFLSTTYLIQ